jgi:ribokinase
MFCLNAAPARAVPAEVLARADLVVANQVERAALGDALFECRGLVAVTLGAEGAYLYQRGRRIAAATPPPVEAVDATGAGDAFCAALVVSLLEGMDPPAALRRACAAGAFAVTVPGAQDSLPTAEEVERLLHVGR